MQKNIGNCVFLWKSTFGGYVHIYVSFYYVREDDTVVMSEVMYVYVQEFWMVS